MPYLCAQNPPFLVGDLLWNQLYSWELYVMGQIFPVLWVHNFIGRKLGIILINIKQMFVYTGTCVGVQRLRTKATNTGRP